MVGKMARAPEERGASPFQVLPRPWNSVIPTMPYQGYTEGLRYLVLSVYYAVHRLQEKMWEVRVTAKGTAVDRRFLLKAFDHSRLHGISGLALAATCNVLGFGEEIERAQIGRVGRKGPRSFWSIAECGHVWRASK